MSDLFLKNNINNNSNNITESSINLANILGMNNNSVGGAGSVTSSANFTMNNNKIFSATSNNFEGGAGSVTSSANLSKINSGDINNLLAMLTSESDANTDTSNLENKLRNMLSQNGGSQDTEATEDTYVLENRLINMLGGGDGDDNISTEALENKINNIIKGPQQTGGAKSFITLAALGLAGTLLNNKITTDSEFNASKVIGQTIQKVAPSNASVARLPSNASVARPVSTKSPASSDSANKIKIAVEVPIDSVTSSEMPNKINQKNLSETSNSVFTKQPKQPFNTPTQNPFIPLTTTTINNNTELSSTSSEMPQRDSRLNQLIGGNNPALIAFREISAMLAKKINIPNGPKAKKIAGQLQRDVKEKNKDITHDDLVEAAKKHLEANLSKYEKMI